MTSEKTKKKTYPFGEPISVHKAAQLAGVSPRTIHRHRHEMAFRRVGARIVISEPALMTWLEASTYGRMAASFRGVAA